VNAFRQPKIRFHLLHKLGHKARKNMHLKKKH